MKASPKAIVLLLSMILLLGSFGVAVGQEIFVNIDEIQGLVDGYIPCGDPVNLVVPVRFANSGADRSCIANGFLFSGDDITFSSMKASWNEDYPWDLDMGFPMGLYPFFDYGLYINFFDVNLNMVVPDSLPGDRQPILTAYGATGVGFAGLSSQQPGLPSDFDDIAYFITLEGVQGECGSVLTIDSSWWAPAGVWLWCGGNTVYPSWGGPYDLLVGYQPYIYTWCTPQPTVLKDGDPLLEVHIRYYNWDDIVLESILIQGKIPPYEGYPIIENGVITTACRVNRFLGASGFRPIPPEGIQSTYTVEFDMADGSHHIMTGDYVLQVSQGDVNLDGVADLADAQFMIDYFWGKGTTCQYEEFMDVDGNGELDIRDALKLIDVAGI